MTITEVVKYIKLQLTGNVLDIELTDNDIAEIVNMELREVQRYIDTTQFITVPFSQCIDLTNSKVSAVVRVYRTNSYNGSNQTGAFYADPMYAQMWMVFTNGGTMYNLNDYVANYGAYNTLLQLRNTTSTDMAFREDKQHHKLYINCLDQPASVTIEYVPIFESVEEIQSDYWIDILRNLSLAQTKLILGRIRSKFTQTNSSLFQLDGETLVAEGTQELQALRERLMSNSQLMYTAD